MVGVIGVMVVVVMVVVSDVDWYFIEFMGVTKC